MENLERNLKEWIFNRKNPYKEEMFLAEVWEKARNEVKEILLNAKKEEGE